MFWSAERGCEVHQKTRYLLTALRSGCSGRVAGGRCPAASGPRSRPRRGQTRCSRCGCWSRRSGWVLIAREARAVDRRSPCCRSCSCGPRWRPRDRLARCARPSVRNQYRSRNQVPRARRNVCASAAGGHGRGAFRGRPRRFAASFRRHEPDRAPGADGGRPELQRILDDVVTGRDWLAPGVTAFFRVRAGRGQARSA